MSDTQAVEAGAATAGSGLEFVYVIYLLSAMMFILGIKRLAKVKTARTGNWLASGAMAVAILGVLIEGGGQPGGFDVGWVIVGVLIGAAVGAYAAIKVEMTEMPEMVAIFNGFGGAASALVPLSVFWSEYIAEETATGTLADALPGGAGDVVTTILSILIGALTFTGSVIAYMKLRGTLNKGNPILLPNRHLMNLGIAVVALFFAWIAGFVTTSGFFASFGLFLLVAGALALGVLLVIPIGGADMPVVVSLLNSYSGVAASMAGFVIGNPLLIVGGALVGASGLILTQIMCVAMNRSLLNVLVGGFGQQEGGGGGSSEYTNVTSAGPEEAAMVLEAASSVIIVPGYGLAVAQAQHTIRELADNLKGRGAKVTYAIHPVAGRMPGHMNVLLAEADVPYEELIEMDLINSEFKNTDVVIVLGANDVVNPDAIDNKSSPIYGMPILNVHDARTVFVIKRSLSPGYAGIKNPLFERDNTMMLFGDAKKMVQDLLREVKEL